MSPYDRLKISLSEQPLRWLVTGAAGFIGSNLVETLLKLNHEVVGLDNFATGHQRYLDEVQNLVTGDEWRKFTFIDGDICELGDCTNAFKGIDYVLHQARWGSVPRSLENPIATNCANITGFLNMLTAARDAKVKSFTYAASSSTYGDHPMLPKVENTIGKPLSPYAVTKYVNELYAEVFARCYDFHSIGLRYFNVFDPRQDPDGVYAAVIPKWTAALLQGQSITIYGDGETSRDFCYITNAVQANLLAASVENMSARNQVYNIAVGQSTTLNSLFYLLRGALQSSGFRSSTQPEYGDFRAGDVRHSKADSGKAVRMLGYAPEDSVEQGIEKAMPWYIKNCGKPEHKKYGPLRPNDKKACHLLVEYRLMGNMSMLKQKAEHFMSYFQDRRVRYAT